jgi:hypothetical protein
MVLKVRLQISSCVRRSKANRTLVKEAVGGYLNRISQRGNVSKPTNLGASYALIYEETRDFHLFSITRKYRGVRVLFGSAYFRFVGTDDDLTFATEINDENWGQGGLRRNGDLAYGQLSARKVIYL